MAVCFLVKQPPQATLLAISLGPQAEFSFREGKLAACFKLPLTITSLKITFKWCVKIFSPHRAQRAVSQPLPFRGA